MLLTDELLLHYKRCQRRAFLDLYGDRQQQNPSPDFLLKLRQDSLTHKKEVLGTLEKRSPAPQTPESLLPSLSSPPITMTSVEKLDLSLSKIGALSSFLKMSTAKINSPDYPREDWEAGAKATIKLMEQGRDCIAQPVLLVHNDEGVTLLSSPDLLIKQPGHSKFGDWMYIPLDIKFGRRPKADYQIISAFHCQVLAAIQEVWPNTAWLILRRQSAYAVTLDRWLPVMVEVLGDCMETMQSRQEPEVFISRQKCDLCHWYNSCYAIAQSQQHISLLPGVSPKRYRELQELEIGTIELLAQTQISILEPIFGAEIACDLVQQAQATIQNRAILRQHYHTLSPSSPLQNGSSTGSVLEFANGKMPHLLKSRDILPSASVELFFDIEAQPELNLDYLLGILVIDHSTQSQRFHPLLAEYPHNEASIWEQFLELVWLYPDAPIFHFSAYEAETVKRLAKLYHTPLSRLKPLLSRFVDVHQRVMSTVLLPVESYSLKHLARWLGFEWRDATITGSQCVLLYDQWLATGDRSLLDRIQSYNEDDCRATYLLKNWLSTFLQQQHSSL